MSGRRKVGSAETLPSVSPSLIAEAERMGRDAFHRGAPCSHHLDAAFMATLNLRVSFGTRESRALIERMDAWARGWHAENLAAPVSDP